jgi:hypothetical protein
MKVFRTLDDVERAGLPDDLLRPIRDWPSATHPVDMPMARH